MNYHDAQDVLQEARIGCWLRRQAGLPASWAVEVRYARFRVLRALRPREVPNLAVETAPADPEDHSAATLTGLCCRLVPATKPLIPLAAGGLNGAEISQELGISKRMVGKHLNALASALAADRVFTALYPGMSAGKRRTYNVFRQRRGGHWPKGMRRNAECVSSLLLATTTPPRALAMAVGVSTRTLGRWRSGEDWPNPLYAEKIKEVLHG